MLFKERAFELIGIIRGIGLFVFSQVIATPLAKLRLWGYGAGYCEMTRHRFRIYFISFLINAWFNIYGSAFLKREIKGENKK